MRGRAAGEEGVGAGDADRHGQGGVDAGAFDARVKELASLALTATNDDPNVLAELEEFDPNATTAVWIDDETLVHVPTADAVIPLSAGMVPVLDIDPVTAEAWARAMLDWVSRQPRT